MSDLKSMFAAAKAQRGTSAPTREQLRALRAQKAAAAKQRPPPAAAASPAAAPAAAASAPRPSVPAAAPAVNRMPPPPPRPPGGALPSPGSPRGAAHFENHGRLPSSAPAPSASGLPAGFFDGSAAPSSPAGPNGIHGARDMPVSEVDVGPAADLPPGFFDAVRAGTPPRGSSSGDSGRRSGSGGLGAGGPHAARDTAMSRPPTAHSTAAGPAAAPAATGTAGSGPAAAEAGGALPKDFFANQADGAKARGEPPPKKPKNAEEQVADFLKSVAGDVRAAEEAEEAAAADLADERAEREAIEQQQRLDRVEALRRQKVAAKSAAALSAGSTSSAAGAASSSGAGPSSSTELKAVLNPAAGEPISAASVSNGVDPEVTAAVAAATAEAAAEAAAREGESKKRRRPSDVLDDSVYDGEGSSSEEDALDWRTKAI